MHWVYYIALSTCLGSDYLEKHRFSHYYLIHSPLDDYIPFVEYFIVPYLLWFLFIAVTIAYFFFTDKKGYYQLTAFLFTGMTIFLIICTVFPNELNCVRTHLRTILFLQDWYNSFTAPIHRRMYCQVFMYIIHLALLSPSDTARH